MKKAVIIVILLIVIVAIIGAVVYFNGEEDATKTEKASNQETTMEKVYKLEYEEKDLTPGTIFLQEQFGEPQQFSEIPSCAFEGTDKVYNYGSFEVTTYQDGDEEKIYSVYFIDDQVATTEGIKIADDLSAMIEKYGEEYIQNGNQYVYTSGNVELKFLVENDVITSITYTLINV